MRTNFIDHLDSIVSIILGILVIISLKVAGAGFFLFIIEILAILSIGLSVVELFKHFFIQEHPFWKSLSVIACMYSIFFSVVVLSAVESVFIPHVALFTDIAKNTGSLTILSLIEIGQGVLWAIINALEGD